MKRPKLILLSTNLEPIRGTKCSSKREHFEPLVRTMGIQEAKDFELLPESTVPPEPGLA
jgi:hypothetical protein